MGEENKVFDLSAIVYWSFKEKLSAPEEEPQLQRGATS